MRIGSVFEWRGNAYYRSMTPLEALARRGHDVVLANGDEDPDVGVFHPERLSGVDVIHAYRQLSPVELRVVRRLVHRGAALVWDTDDDLATLPAESPRYRENGGPQAQRRIFAQTVEIAREAQVVTTTTEPLAETYREQGVERIEVIGNYLPPQMVRTRRRAHDGLVIGWVAGLEHRAELPRIPIVDALRRIAEVHPRVRIASLGVDLGLPRDRYAHLERSDWSALQEHIAGWDIAIAPLSDIPFNRTRSNIKLKEYAGVGVPWLASPIGPYAALGEQQGGRLVPDDGWFEALDRLVRHRWERVRLGRKARAWAKTQSIDRAVDRWERVCVEAMERRARRRLRV